MRSWSVPSDCRANVIPLQDQLRSAIEQRDVVVYLKLYLINCQVYVQSYARSSESRIRTRRAHWFQCRKPLNLRTVIGYIDEGKQK